VRRPAPGGTYARYRLGGAIHARVGPDFPWGTLSVNVGGSFVLGLLLPVLGVHGPLTSIRAVQQLEIGPRDVRELP
jgi:fluoride ion exporter CrcB/FEX